jgi:hypothetical protein
MRSRIAFLALCGVSPLALTDRLAHAAECDRTPGICVNAEALWPHAGPARFVAVGATETVTSGQLGFALVATYLSRPVVLHVATPGGGGSDQFLINDQVNGTFLWSYGVSDRLQLDVALPLTFEQTGTGLAPVTGSSGLSDTAVRDMRFGFAYALMPHRRVAPAFSNAWGLVGRLEVSAPTGDDDQFAGERSAVFVPSLAADYRMGRLFAGAELGARVRPTTDLLGARVGSQIVTSLGVGYDVLPRELLSATLEAWALPTFAEQNDVTRDGERPNGLHIVPAEWQLSVRTAPLAGGDLSFQIGGGGQIPPSQETEVTRPRFRFTLGVRWAPLAHDTDGDGVLDSVDKCPAAPARGTPDGCPPAAQADHAPAPAVELRLPLANACPPLPEDFAGLTDGCPERHR